jgi:hypothetical protein
MSDGFLTHYEITVGGLALVPSFVIAFKLPMAQKRFGAPSLMIMHQSCSFIHISSSRYSLQMQANIFSQWFISGFPWFPQSELSCLLYGANPWHNSKIERIWVNSDIQTCITNFFSLYNHAYSKIRSYWNEYLYCNI